LCANSSMKKCAGQGFSCLYTDSCMSFTHPGAHALIVMQGGLLCSTITDEMTHRFDRWQGRPATPPFRWSGTDEVRPSQDEWIHNLDLREFVAPALLGPGYESLTTADLKALKVRASSSALSLLGHKHGNSPPDVGMVQEALIKASGPLQAVFLMFQLRVCPTSSPLGFSSPLGREHREGDRAGG
jgi:hypothetical protein